MYDITSEESFLNLRNWITSIRETAYNSKLKIVIIGNKLDLVREEIPRGVERRDAETLAKVISI
jgi:Ras-related protein Rab-27B